MVELGNCRITYHFTGEVDVFKFTGQCIFNPEKLLEIQARVEIKETDSSSGEILWYDAGDIFYNSYTDDGKGSLTVHTKIVDMTKLSNASYELIDEIIAAR